MLLKMIPLLQLIISTTKLLFYKPKDKEDDLNPTHDGKACEESHGASKETQLALHLDLLVSLDVVEGGRVKVDLHQLES